MYDDELYLDLDNYMDINFDNSNDTELSEEQETETIVSGFVQSDEFFEQIAIVQNNQVAIINNLSYQSNLLTFGFFVFVFVLVMKCLLHFFN